MTREEAKERFEECMNNYKQIQYMKRNTLLTSVKESEAKAKYWLEQAELAENVLNNTEPQSFLP